MKQAFAGEGKKKLIADFGLESGSQHSRSLLGYALIYGTGFGVLAVVIFGFAGTEPLMIAFRIVLAVGLAYTLYILYREIRALKMGMGLRIYSNGFLVPRVGLYERLKDPLFISYNEIVALWFRLGGEKQNGPRGWGVDLGVDPVRELGRSICEPFDSRSGPIPNDIEAVRVLAGEGPARQDVAFERSQLNDGERALRTLVSNILLARGMEFYEVPPGPRPPAYKDGGRDIRQARPVAGTAPPPAYRRQGPLPEPKFEKPGLVPQPVYEHRRP